MATAATQEELNPFEIAKQQFDRAADYLDLEQSLRNVLRSKPHLLLDNGADAARSVASPSNERAPRPVAE